MKALAVALAVLVIPAAAEAAAKHPRHHYSKAVRGSYAAQPQIACTAVGCLPVPRGCHPAGGRTYSGAPSGFDVMVCPGVGTMYGNR